MFQVTILNDQGQPIEPIFNLAKYELDGSDLINRALYKRESLIAEFLSDDYFATCLHHFCSQASGQLAEKGGFLDTAKMGIIDGLDIKAFTPVYIKRMSILFFVVMSGMYFASHKLSNHNEQLFKKLDFLNNTLPHLNENDVDKCLVKSMEIIKQLSFPGMNINITSNTKAPIYQSTSSAQCFFNPSQVKLELNKLFEIYTIKEPDNKSLKTKCEHLLRRIASQGAYQHMQRYFSLPEVQETNADVDALAPESKKAALHWLVKLAQTATSSRVEDYLLSYALLIEHGARTDILDNDNCSPLDYDAKLLFSSSPKNAI